MSASASLTGAPCSPAGDNAERLRAYEIAAYLSASSFPFSIPEGPPPNPASSSDLTLNALVQHGVHKLDCDRAFLSLIDNRQQFICSEMTKHQSLAGPDPEEPLLLGTSRIALEWGVCPYTMAVFSGNTNVNLPDSPYIIADKSYFYIKDFRQIPTFAARPYVAGYPNMVSYIEVPLKSLSGHIVGSYCVVDNKSRDFLAPKNMDALREVALAINGYLDSKRLEASRTRSEKMMEELCKLVDTGSHMDAPKNRGIDAHPSHTSPFDLGLFKEASETDEHDAQVKSSVSSPFSPQNDDSESHKVDEDTSVLSTTCKQQDASQQPKSNLGASINSLLSRAAAAIGHGMDLDGFVIFDSVITGTQQSKGVSSSFFTGDQGSRPIARDQSPVSALAEYELEEGATEILESFPSLSTLQRLTVRYPHGHVFAMDEFGILERGDGKDVDAERHLAATSDGDSDRTNLFGFLPKARYAIFLPLWHYKRESCYATCLAWVSDQGKTLDFSDVNSLAAFGNSLMAEILRIEARIHAQVKSDFVSSISHELRSPLHGIMATLELMQNHVDDPQLLSMIDMIESCSSALLDTFDHLLEYSRINSRGRNSKQTDMDETKQNLSDRHEKGELADLSSIVEEITEVVAVGHSAAARIGARLKKEDQILPANPTDLPRPLLITTYTQRPCDWTMSVDIGAWKRILMNILSNALKYTKIGHIDVSLNIKEQLDGNSVINLSVTDTGIGISPEFLRDHLFTPFKQESDLYPGTGLGLSMVKSIVDAMKGEILVESALHKGTCVSVNVPVNRRVDVSSTPEQFIFPHDGLRGCTLGLASAVVVNSSSGNRQCNIGPAAEVLQRCVRNICGYLQLTYVDMSADVVPHSDFVILDTHNILATDELDPDSLFLGHLLPDPPPSVVVLGTTSKVLEQLKMYTRATSITSPITVKRVVAALHTVMATVESKDEVMRSQLEETGLRGKDGPSTVPHIHENLPIRPRQISELPTREAIPLQPQTQSRFRRFLLVDDNVINLRVLASFVKRLGGAYTTAFNGAEAVRLYQRAASDEKNPYDCIFMDISMPVVDGFQATAMIREFEEQHRRGQEENDTGRPLSRAYILALTGLGSEAARNEAEDSGIDVFLLKPIKFKDVVPLLQPVP